MMTQGKPHAEDDGFPPQENPSKTASATREAEAGEKGSEAGGEEREGRGHDRFTTSDTSCSMTSPGCNSWVVLLIAAAGVQHEKVSILPMLGVLLWNR
jgi:hypothetical protein